MAKRSCPLCTLPVDDCGCGDAEEELEEQDEDEIELNSLFGEIDPPYPYETPKSIDEIDGDASSIEEPAAPRTSPGPRAPTVTEHAAAPATGGRSRTDRHNNPTAFTVDIARQAGLVEGVDFTQGDPFPGNTRQRTARLLGDAVETTIRVLDRIGFYTQGGQQRWTHTALPYSEWQMLSYGQRRAVIARMYHHEGGTELEHLFQ